MIVMIEVLNCWKFLQFHKGSHLARIFPSVFVIYGGHDHGHIGSNVSKVKSL